MNIYSTNNKHINQEMFFLIKKKIAWQDHQKQLGEARSIKFHDTIARFPIGNKHAHTVYNWKKKYKWLQNI